MSTCSNLTTETVKWNIGYSDNRLQFHFSNIVTVSNSNMYALSRNPLINIPLQLPDENLDSDGDDEIYRGILATQIKLVKGFSLTTSLISLSCQPVLYYSLQVIHLLVG